MSDKLKLGLAGVLVLTGIAGYYFLRDAAPVLRLVSVLAGIGAGVAVAWFSEPGQQFYSFGRDSWGEARKVVWPSRKETIQTTMVVMVFVLVMAIFLWMVDAALMYAVKLLMGRGD